MYIFRR